MGLSPLGTPGVEITPCSAFCRQPRCRRRGEEGSWNNKGKLGRAQGGAARAGPRGEPCTAGSSEAAWPPAGGTGGRKEKRTEKERDLRYSIPYFSHYWDQMPDQKLLDGHSLRVQSVVEEHEAAITSHPHSGSTEKWMRVLSPLPPFHFTPGPLPVK